jgi:hypothetical protein
MELQNGAVEEWTEVGPDHRVLREIAFDRAGKVVHLFPSDKYRDGERGHFDLSPVSTDLPSDPLVTEEFDERWEVARKEAESLPAPRTDIEDFWRRFVARINGTKWLESLFVMLTAVILLILGVAVLAFGLLSAAGGR